MNCVEEPAREGFLYHLWLERSFQGRLLQSTEGHQIEIMEKGTRNRDAGPDFLDALVRINGKVVRGDVEVHAVAGDWYAHGHHRDPRYNKVVLHVVTMDCPPAFRAVKENGAAAVTLNLDDYLEKSAEQLEQEEDEAPPQTQECALSREPLTVIRAVLERAGDLRLQRKAARFRERPAAQSWDQVFYEFLMEALGYSKNRVPFRKLAVFMPIETLWAYTWSDPEDTALLKSQALLFGTAGLLPSQSGIAASDDYVSEMEAWWRTLSHRGKFSSLRPEEWQFFRLRPANFPTRRVAAAASLACRFREQGFIAAFVKAFAESSAGTAQIIRELEAMMTMDADAFWSKRYTFEEESGIVDLQLVGSERARDIVVNTVLPALLAYAEESDDGKLKNGVLQVFQSYPRLSSNDLIRIMQKQLFAWECEKACVRGARHQQGMIQLRQEWCGPGDCRRCLSLVQQGGKSHAFH
ncbi:MAG: DUF2851 family protein [candidate division KSB1 bacterium]|nr:DUF2851 family protein [candidate division KSB1 bacterium]